MNKRLRMLCVVLVLICIALVQAERCGACEYECDVPYRICATDGRYYPDGSVPFQYGQVVYFDCNCVKVYILNDDNNNRRRR